MIKKQKQTQSIAQQRLARSQRGWGLINKLIVTGMVAGIVVFVIAINDLSVKGFVLRELKINESELRAENENLELAVMELRALENIQSRAKELKMVKVDNIEYVTITEDSVAKN